MERPMSAIETLALLEATALLSGLSRRNIERRPFKSKCRHDGKLTTLAERRAMRKAKRQARKKGRR